MKKIISMITLLLFVLALREAKAQALPSFGSSPGTGNNGVTNSLPGLSKSATTINTNSPAVNIITSGAGTANNSSTTILPGAGTNTPLLPGNGINRTGNNGPAVNVPGNPGNVSNATSIPVIAPGHQ